MPFEPLRYIGGGFGPLQSARMNDDDSDLFEHLVIARSEDDVNIPEALAIFDNTRLRAPTGEELFPREPRVGRCRICGATSELTREHIPPRSSQHEDRARAPTFADWFRRDDLDLPEAGPVIQGGVSGYVLCANCNNVTGTRYGREYQVWAYGAAAVLTSLGVSLEELDRKDQYAYLNLRLVDVYPGRFIRQVLSMLLSVSGSHELAERHPELPQLVLAGAPVQLPAPLSLFMTLYAGPVVRFAGGPWGQAIYQSGSNMWTWCIEIAFPPFAFQLILDGDTDTASGVDISKFSSLDPDESQEFNIEGLMVGFGHTPYPLDYRPRGMFEV